MEQRHAVRSCNDKKIKGEVKEKLEQKIKACNAESGLHIQLVLNEPKAFDSFLAHYGKFSGVTLHRYCWTKNKRPGTYSNQSAEDNIVA